MTLTDWEREVVSRFDSLITSPEGVGWGDVPTAQIREVKQIVTARLHDFPERWLIYSLSEGGPGISLEWEMVSISLPFGSLDNCYFHGMNSSGRVLSFCFDAKDDAGWAVVGVSVKHLYPGVI
jgi:hypothetical protein